MIEREPLEHLSDAERSGLHSAMAGLCLLPECRKTTALMQLVISVFDKNEGDRNDFEQELVAAFSGMGESCSTRQH